MGSEGKSNFRPQEVAMRRRRLARTAVLLAVVGIIFCFLEGTEKIGHHFYASAQHFESVFLFGGPPRHPAPALTGPSKVVVLQDSTIESFIANEEAALIMYYAPWCQHSVDMAPHLDAAAELLSHQLAHVKIAKIDMTTNPESQRKHNIVMYPTTKMYLDGAEHDYTGGRRHTDIVKWVSGFMETEISITSPEHLKTTLAVHHNDFVVIGGFDAAIKHRTNDLNHTVLDVDPSAAIFGSLFVKLSRTFKNLFFADVYDPAVIASLVKQCGLRQDYKLPFLAVINPFGGGKAADVIGSRDFDLVFEKEPHLAEYKGSFVDLVALKAFLSSYQFPLVVPFAHQWIDHVFSDGRPIFALFTDHEHASVGKHIASIGPVAERYRGKMLFVVSHQKNVLDQRLMGLVGAQNSPYPTFRIFTVNPTGHKSWSPLLKFGPGEPLRNLLETREGHKQTSDAIMKFASDYFADKLTPHLESEPVPQPENDGAPVRQLVGLTFEKIVKRSPHDVFVVFSAPWCGHCRKLEPALLELGRRLARLGGSIRICKMDATRNEVPGLTFHAYPAIMLFNAKDKTTPLQYQGNRSVPDMIRWIAKNAHNTFDPEAIINEPEPEMEPLLDSEEVNYKAGEL